MKKCLNKCVGSGFKCNLRKGHHGDHEYWIYKWKRRPNLKAGVRVTRRYPQKSKSGRG